MILWSSNVGNGFEGETAVVWPVASDSLHTHQPCSAMFPPTGLQGQQDSSFVSLDVCSLRPPPRPLSLALVPRRHDMLRGKTRRIFGSRSSDSQRGGQYGGGGGMNPRVVCTRLRLRVCACRTRGNAGEAALLYSNACPSGIHPPRGWSCSMIFQLFALTPRSFGRSLF